jgi:acyl-CoA synthetase (AMP-forming)/AMP-acid ligase II
VSVADLPPLKRFRRAGVQRYVKMVAGDVRARDVSSALTKRRADRQRIDPELSHDDLPGECRRAASHRQHDRGRKGHDARTGACSRTSPAASAWKPYLQPGAEVLLTALPLYHIFAFTANLMLFFAVGGRNILIPSPRPFTNLKRVMEREPVTWFTGVNTLFIALMNEPWFQAIRTWRLKGTVAGGMALAPAVGERWEQMTKTPIYQGYGLTETAPVVTLTPFHRAKMTSIGVPIPGTDIRLVDDQGNDVPQGQAGELLVHGARVMAGYWQRRETAKVIRTAGCGPATSRRWTGTAICRSSIEEGHDPRERLQRVSNEVEALLAADPRRSRKSPCSACRIRSAARPSSRSSSGVTRR